MHLLRTRFKKDIVCEFLPPLKNSKKQKVIINCAGAPGVPSKKNDLALFFAKKGYWFFSIRYRGSWESGGEFLGKSPHMDVLDVLDGLSKGFVDAWSEKKYKVIPDEVVLLGGSFGGPAVLLNSNDERVNKVIAISPVIDWTYPSKYEPLDWMYGFIKRAFGGGYRLTKKNWNKLSNGEFYNPIGNTESIDGSKILIIHAEDDKVCSIIPVKKFIKLTNAKYRFYKRGGHSLKFDKPPILDHIINFIKS